MTSVLIVDDDAAFRTTIGRDLADQGFAVSLAHDADEAIALLSDRGIDVLLTDLRMPGADGIDLLAQVRILAPRTRTILMSGYASARDYQRAIECGAVRVVSKPFTSGELLQAIRQAVECETGFRGSIHGLSLVDLLQMFHYARRSLAIIVDGLAPGQVLLEDGHVIHAVYRELQGELALQAILAMPAGSLRTVDEDALPASDWEPDEHHASVPGAAAPHLQRLIEALRRLDGYSAALMIDGQSGLVVGGDHGVSDRALQTAAAGYSELYRLERDLVGALGISDEIEDVVITTSSQYHVLHAVAGQPSLLLCVVLDRNSTSLGLARYAIKASDQRTRGGSP